MCMYLKNQGGCKMSHFKGISYEEIRPIFERVWDQIQSFVPMDSGKEKGSEKKSRGRRKKSLARKRARETLSEESAKKQKLRRDDIEKTRNSSLFETLVLEQDVLELYRLVKDRFHTQQVQKVMTYCFEAICIRYAVSSLIGYGVYGCLEQYLLDYVLFRSPTPRNRGSASPDYSPGVRHETGEILRWTLRRLDYKCPQRKDPFIGGSLREEIEPLLMYTLRKMVRAPFTISPSIEAAITKEIEGSSSTFEIRESSMAPRILPVIGKPIRYEGQIHEMQDHIEEILLEQIKTMQHEIYGGYTSMEATQEEIETLQAKLGVEMGVRFTTDTTRFEEAAASPTSTASPGIVTVSLGFPKPSAR
ncbi:hypothetical protein Tco_0483515 [Tanacetum coccineum]